MEHTQSSTLPASHTLGALAEFLSAELVGDETCLISGIATLAEAQSSQLSFLANNHYLKFLTTTQAGAVILHPDVAADFHGNKLLHPKPYLAYAKLTALFADKPRVAEGVHPSAVVSDRADIHADASIGPHCVVEAGASIAAGAQLGAGSFVGENSQIGQNTVLCANVSIYHGVTVGAECLIHSQVVIGSDGFGFAPDGKGWVKIHQLGGVVIGDRVELGAGTTVDRGALDDTCLSDGVIVDNQVQIAHNVRIGANTAIAAGCAIAGSAIIGSGCTIAGMVGIVGHLTIVDGVHVTAKTLVTKSISKAGSYSSGTPMDESANWRKNAVRYGQLNTLAARVKSLEKLQRDPDAES